MFELLDIEDHIPLPAPTFPRELAAFPLCSTSSESAKLDLQQQQPSTSSSSSSSSSNLEILADTRSRFRHALLSAIASKFLFRVIPDVGLVVSIASLLQVSDDTHLLPGQSKVWVHCQFTAVVFKPQIGSRVRAKIVEQSREMGMRLSVEFFDQIFVPPQCLVEGSEWEPAIQQWGMRDANGAFIRYVSNTNTNQQQQQQQKQNNIHSNNEESSKSPEIDKMNRNKNNSNEDDAAATVVLGGGRSPVAADPLSQFAPPVPASSVGMMMMINSPSSQPGSVICVVDKVFVVSSSQHNNNSIQQLQDDGNNNNANALPTLSTNSMKIFANFSACDGLGPEAWFEENA